MIPLIGSTSSWLTLTAASLAMGMMIFIMASGLTLVFGLMDVLNFGHGAFIAVGAYVATLVLAPFAASIQADSLWMNLAVLAPAALLSMAGRPVRTAQDLVGARVLGQQGVQPYVEAAMRIAGVPIDYEFIPVGYEPSPLVEGQGDVYTCFATNQPIMLEQQGMVADRDFVVTTYEQLGLPQYASLLCSQRSWLEGNRPVVERFMRATIRGWQDNTADPSVAARLAVENYGADLGLDLAQQTRENELQIPYTQSELTQAGGLFRIDPERISGPMYAAYAAAGVSPLPDISRIIDTSVLDAVFQGRSTI